MWQKNYFMKQERHRIEENEIIKVFIIIIMLYKSIK